MKKKRVSVVDLVNFACRSGDLINAGPAGPTARQGIRAHQKLQRQVESDAQTEVSIRVDVSVADVTITLGGRIDIVIPDPDLPEIHEIKSTLVSPQHIPDGVKEQHWAQLKVYGFCYLVADDKQTDSATSERICLKLLWHNLQDESTVVDQREYSLKELAEFTTNAVKVYAAWLTRVDSQRAETLKTAKALSFPHNDFRTGQRDFAAASYRVFRDGGYLLCEAPTGIGKTISALFPAIKAIGDDHLNTVTWLTAKTSGRTVAMESVALMEAGGLSITSLSLSSKATTCHCSNGTCSRNQEGRCPLTIGFFDRLPEARAELLELRRIDTVSLDRVATKHQVCPFELALQMIPWVSIVICDYNYVFDPLVVLTFYADPHRKMALLMDESHNLVDRARGMYSARLTKFQSQSVKSDCADSHPLLVSALSKVDRALSRWAKQQDQPESSSDTPPKLMNNAVSDAVEALVSAMEIGPTLPESAREWFRELFRYQVINELFGEHHQTVTRIETHGKRKNVELKLMCVNATDRLEKTLSRFRSVVAFSATLRPMHYYCTALGFPEDVKTLELPSPFNPENLCCLVCPFVDTRYHARARSERDVVQLIKSVVNARVGNYIIFFPSYAYLESVYRTYVLEHPDENVVIQERNSSIDERERFLEQFDGSSRVIGFAIIGGVFGEGIDFPGEKLIGCIVVGTGLPGVGIETKLISDDYQDAGLNGFDYACRYPGFTRVLQTAGRVIRKEDDRGIVVLVDTRFRESFYQSLFPVHWQLTVCRDHQQVVANLENFWITE